MFLLATTWGRIFLDFSTVSVFVNFEEGFFIVLDACLALAASIAADKVKIFAADEDFLGSFVGLGYF